MLDINDAIAIVNDMILNHGIDPQYIDLDSLSLKFTPRGYKNSRGSTNYLIEDLHLCFKNKDKEEFTIYDPRSIEYLES